MLINTKELYGSSLAALNGDIGHIKDFYFDDENWVIRYVVADTGTWLTSRLVLLSPHAFGHLDLAAKQLHIKLTRERIESSPSIESHRPVSRQYEVDYFRHYGWPAYWNGGGMWGMGGFPTPIEPTIAEMDDRQHIHHREDKHLQSARALSGYEIQTVDGTIGSVSGLVVDDRSWVIHEMTVQAGHWYSGKEILIPTGKIERISYEGSKVFVNLTKADIEQASDKQLAGAGMPSHID